MEKTTWWAAADKNGRQFAHPSLPKRNEKSGWWTNEKEFYHYLGNDFVHGLKWEDDPVEIEVSFKPKKGDGESYWKAKWLD